MSHHAHAVVFHLVRHLRRRDPLRNLPPRSIAVLHHPRHLMKVDPTSPEHIRNFRHRASLAMSQPLPGHRRPVLHLVERLIINRGQRRQVQQDHRHLRPPHHRQHSRRQRIRRHMQKNQINIPLPKRMSGRHTLLSRIHHPQVQHLSPKPRELPLNRAVVPLQPLPQAAELSPVRFQANAEQANPMPLAHTRPCALCFHTQNLMPPPSWVPHSCPRAWGMSGVNQPRQPGDTLNAGLSAPRRTTLHRTNLKILPLHAAL